MDSYSTLLGASLFTLLLLLAIVIVTLVGKWKVYAKLGMPGWYSLIPVFSATSSASESAAVRRTRHSSWHISLC